MVEKSNLSHIKKLAQCRILAFPNSLSSKLGLSFCTKMIEWIVVNPQAEALHITNPSGEIVGYISVIKYRDSGVPDSFSGMSTYVLKSFVYSLLLRPWLIFHAGIWGKRKAALKVIINKFKIKGSPAKNDDSYIKNFVPNYGILDVAVIPQYQGSGFGSLLLEAAANLCREEGIQRLGLCVLCDNKQAIKSYVKNGFFEVQREEDKIFMRKNIEIK